MTRNRSDALVQDIAKLFVDYSAREWRPLLDELTAGGPVQKRVADAVETMLVKTEIARTRAKAAKSKANKAVAAKRSATRVAPKAGKEVVRVPAERVETLAQLTKALDAGHILTTRASMADVFEAMGGKVELPKSRKDAAIYLLAAMADASDTVYEAALKAIAQHAMPVNTGDYQLWFDIIRPTASGTAAAKPSSQAVSKPGR